MTQRAREERAEPEADPVLDGELRGLLLLAGALLLLLVLARALR